ncbi:RHS repeat protein [Pseudomonas sp. PDM23]|uniref:DUF6531 domain-containing protein n=1 Tax=unclassified Pseudomonas TaxID=196821 RepID=UPI0017834511|nr:MULTISPECIES: DUF6531 domain-containing protein [unclassified Pseudomonas]MBD9576095.1 RHS repeat protein [Pseudomonas sp. PDM23]MBD9668960.1 RHS repeat protein [Pseudomonas sp. PDM21]
MKPHIALALAIFIQSLGNYSHAETYTFWFTSNTPKPVFGSAKEVCDFLYSDWWPHLADRYLPDENYYNPPETLRCAMKTSTGFTAFGAAQKSSITCANGTTFDFNSKQCLLANHKGRPTAAMSCDTPSPTQGNPINIAIGNKYQEELDYSSKLFGFSRSYNSVDGLWRHSLSTHLTFINGNVLLINSDGSEHLFSPIDGKFVSKTTPGSIITGLSSYTYNSANSEILTFSSSGKLTSITSKPGITLQLSYTDKTITVSYDQHAIAKISEDSLHQPKSFTSENTAIVYTYDAIRLKSASKTSNGITKTTNYTYSPGSQPGLLTSITDANGITFAKWSYDSQGRAVSSEHAQGTNKVDLTYIAPDTVTATNEYNKKTTYHFSLVQGQRLIDSITGQASTNCPYSNSNYTYNSQGLLEKMADANGNLTTYDYNDRGLETSRTEAFGTQQARTTTTEWHPTLFLKTKVIEPDRITTYQYDAQGRQTGQIVTPR